MFSRIVSRAAVAFVLAVPPAHAGADDLAALGAALQFREAFGVMSEEGKAYGAQVEADMFPGSGGAAWDRAVGEIYDVERMLPVFTGAFEAELEQSGADIPAMLAFFGSDLGRKVTTLEISGRRALLDEAVEDASRLKYHDLALAGDPRIDLVDAFVAVNDLVEANVAGAMNANYAFYQGLGDAGALRGDMADDQIIAEIWSQEEPIREETEIWIRAYLAMAYAPLSDDELRDYTAFSDTEAGRDLNAAMFVGFDAVFTDVSRQLGRAAGALMAGQDL